MTSKNETAYWIAAKGNTLYEQTAPERAIPPILDALGYGYLRNLPLVLNGPAGEPVEASSHRDGAAEFPNSIDDETALLGGVRERRGLPTQPEEIQDGQASKGAGLVECRPPSSPSQRGVEATPTPRRIVLTPDLYITEHQVAILVDGRLHQTARQDRKNLWRTGIYNENGIRVLIIDAGWTEPKFLRLLKNEMAERLWRLKTGESMREELR